MTTAEFFGGAFVAFGPALAIFCLTIAKDPIRIIILIASAFFWLLSLLLSSCVWMTLAFESHLVVGMLISVMFQELFRFFVYKLLRQAEFGLLKITEHDLELINNKHILAYVAGLGFGLMGGLFGFIDVLADSVGPATVGLISGTSAFVMTSATFTLMFILLHTFWSVMFFAGLDDKNYYNVAYVLISHFAASSLTLLNGSQEYSGSIPILLCFVIVILTGVLAFRAAGGTLRTLKQSLKLCAIN